MKPADKEEILKVYDENHNFIKMEKRSVVHDLELWHNEIALWIIDPTNNKVLMQKRSKYKKINPNIWAIVAGHVVGEDSILDTLYKECSEEIGVDLNEYEPQFLTEIKVVEPKNHNFASYFYVFAKIPLEEIKIQKEELSEVKYLDYEYVKQLAQKSDKSIGIIWDKNYQKIFKALDKVIYKERK